MFYTNHLARLLYGQPMQPMNMLAQNDFDPNGIVAKLLAQQRAAEAARAAQAAQQGQPQQVPQPGMESATQALLRRMREAGLDQ